MVHSGPRPPIRLVACIAPALDGGSSVFMGSLPENLALVAVGPWVGRRYEDVITSVVAMGPWVRRRYGNVITSVITMD